MSHRYVSQMRHNNSNPCTKHNLRSKGNNNAVFLDTQIFMGCIYNAVYDSVIYRDEIQESTH